MATTKLTSTVKLPHIKPNQPTPSTLYRPNAQQPAVNSRTTPFPHLDLSDWTWKNILNHSVSALNKQKHDVIEPVQPPPTDGNTFITQLQSELDTHIQAVNAAQTIQVADDADTGFNKHPPITSIVPVLSWERDESVQLLHIFEHMLGRIDQHVTHGSGRHTSSGVSANSIQLIDDEMQFVTEQQTVYNVFFDHVIKQVSRNCRERGTILIQLQQRYNALLAQTPNILSTIKSQLTQHRTQNIELQQTILQLRKQIKQLNDSAYGLNEQARMHKQQASDLQIKYEHMQLKYKQVGELHAADVNELNSAHAITHNRLLHEQREAAEQYNAMQLLTQKLHAAETMNETLQQQLTDAFKESMRQASHGSIINHNKDSRPSTKLSALRDAVSDDIDGDKQRRDSELQQKERQQAELAMANAALLSQRSKADDSQPSSKRSTATSLHIDIETAPTAVSDQPAPLTSTPSKRPNKQDEKVASATKARKPSVIKVGFNSHMKLNDSPSVKPSSKPSNTGKPVTGQRKLSTHAAVKQRIKAVMPQLTEDVIEQTMQSSNVERLIQLVICLESNNNHAQADVVKPYLDSVSGDIPEEWYTAVQDKLNEHTQHDKLQDILLNVEQQYHRSPTPPSHVFHKPTHKPSSAVTATVHTTQTHSAVMHGQMFKHAVDGDSRRSSTEIVSVKRTPVSKHPDKRRSSGRYAIAEQAALLADNAYRKKMSDAATDSRLPVTTSSDTAADTPNKLQQHQKADVEADTAELAEQVDLLPLPSHELPDLTALPSTTSPDNAKKSSKKKTSVIILTPKSNGAAKSTTPAPPVRRSSVLSAKRTKQTVVSPALRRIKSTFPVKPATEPRSDRANSQSVTTSVDRSQTTQDLSSDDDDSDILQSDESAEASTNNIDSELIATYDTRINELEVLVQTLIQQNKELQAASVQRTERQPSLPTAQQTHQIIEMHSVHHTTPVHVVSQQAPTVQSNLHHAAPQSMAVTVQSSALSAPVGPQLPAAVTKLLSKQHDSVQEEKQQQSESATLTAAQSSLQLFLQRAKQHLNTTHVEPSKQLTILPPVVNNDGKVHDRLCDIVRVYTDKLQQTIDAAKTSYNSRSFSEVVRDLTSNSVTPVPTHPQIAVSKLIQLIEDVYDSKTESDAICTEQQYTVLTMPHYVIQSYKQRYGLGDYVTGKVAHMLQAVEQYVATNNYVALFLQFLNEQRTLYQLTLFLQLRRVVNSVADTVQFGDSCTATPCISISKAQAVLNNVFKDKADVHATVMQQLQQHTSANNVSCVTLQTFYSVMIHQFIVLQHQQQLHDMAADLFAACATQRPGQQPLIMYDRFKMICQLLQPSCAVLTEKRVVATKYAQLCRDTGCDGASLEVLQPMIYQMLCDATLKT